MPDAGVMSSFAGTSLVPRSLTRKLPRSTGAQCKAQGLSGKSFRSIWRCGTRRAVSGGGSPRLRGPESQALHNGNCSYSFGNQLGCRHPSISALYPHLSRSPQNHCSSISSRMSKGEPGHSWRRYHFYFFNGFSWPRFLQKPMKAASGLFIVTPDVSAKLRHSRSSP